MHGNQFLSEGIKKEEKKPDDCNRRKRNPLDREDEEV